MGMPSVQDCAVVLDLLDSATGQPLQTWRFTSQTRILIGRAPDGDVVVSNPYVSRAHAYVEFADGTWQVVAISSQQLLVDQRRVNSVELFEGCVFQLGSSGCALRFSRECQTSAVPESGKTLSFNANDHPFLCLDQKQLMHDVEEIANGSFFQNLSANVKRLRQTKKVDADFH